MKLKSINCTFLTDGDILSLNRVNIHTSEQMVAHADLETLSRQAKVPIKSLKMLKKFIIGQYAPFPQSANELLSKYVRNFFIIKFGCQKIDDLIANGVYSGEITDITGLSGTGKTQMCLNLVANMLSLNSSHKCLYIDSNKNFCIRRMQQLLKTSANSLNAVQLIDCQNCFHLMDIIYQIKKTTSKSPDLTNPIKTPNLLIIDNLTILFNILNKTGTANHLDMSFYLNSIVSRLSFLATSMNMAVVITNNVSKEPDTIFNETWKKFAGLEIQLLGKEETNSAEDEQEFRLIKCNRPVLKENSKSCRFRFNDNGFE